MTSEEQHIASRPSVDALRERVDNQGAAIRALADDTATSFRDLRAEVSRSFGDFTASLKGLDVKMDAQAKSVNDSQRPQYLGLFGAITAAVGLSVTIMSTLSGLHDKPIDDKLTSLREAIGDLTKGTAAGLADAAKASVSQLEYAQTTAAQDRLSDVKTAQYRATLAVLQAQVDKTQADEVPRREHEFHWAAEDKIDTHLEAEITQLGRRLDDLAPASDTLKTLTQREHELEVQVFGRRPGSP